MKSLILRIQYVFSAYENELIVTLLVIAVISTILTGSALLVPQETKQATRQVNNQSSNVALNAGATVTENSSLYPTGRHLRNADVYFLTATPTINLSVRTSINQAERASITQEIAIVVIGTANGKTIYHNVTTLTRETKTINEGYVVTTAELSIPEFQRDQLTPLRQEVGGEATFETYVRASSTYNTGKYNDTLTISQPLSISGNSYTLETPKSENRTYSESSTQQVIQPANPTPPAWIRALVALAAFLGAILLHRSSITDRSPKQIKQLLTRKRYAEWISPGTIPNDSGARTVKVDSMKDVVETGLDTNGRVIHDEAASTFAVFDGNTLYKYSYRSANGQYNNDPLAGHPETEDPFIWQRDFETDDPFDRQSASDEDSATRRWVASAKRWSRRLVPWATESGPRNNPQDGSSIGNERDSAANDNQSKRP